MPKPAANKPAATKPAQKTSQPKKQVANQVTKKETKPVVNATPKQNEKRKREENGSTPVHDVDKKMKEAPESVVTTAGKRILLTNVPETAQPSDIEVLFSGLSEKPFIRIYTFRNKERVGHAMLTFKDDDSYNHAISLSNLSIHGQPITTVLDLTCEESRSVFIPFFPGAFDESDIRQFFEGLEIARIIYFTSFNGRVNGRILIEFADEESRQAAVGKSKTSYNEQNVLVYPMVLNKERKPKTLKQKVKKAPTPVPANETQPKATEKKVQKAAPKNPNQTKPAPAKKPNQAKTAPAKNPNQTKPAPAKKPNQPAQGKKTPAAKPNAKSAKPQANGKPKAQKKN